MIRCTPMAVYSPLSMKHTRTLKSQCSCQYNYVPKIVRAAAHSVFLYLTPVSYSAGNKRKYWNHCKEYLTIHGQDKTRAGLNFMNPSRRNSNRNKMFALSNKVDEINDDNPLVLTSVFIKLCVV